jgi:hypothetical protein
MMKIEDQELDKLLKSRPFISPQEDLRNRIAKTARSVTQKTDESIGKWLQDLFVEFIVLKPIYAWGLVLVLGLCVGFVSTGQSMHERGIGIHANQIQDFLYVKRSFL